MKYAATTPFLLLLLAGAACGQPTEASKRLRLDGSWHVPARVGSGHIGIVRITPRAKAGEYRLKFIMGDGSLRFLNGSFDGSTLTTYRGDSAPAASAGDAIGAVGALTGSTDPDAATSSEASAPAVGRYALNVVDGSGDSPGRYSFVAKGAVSESGLMPVASFARTRIRVRIDGPPMLRLGNRGEYRVLVSPASAAGEASWSVSGAYVHWSARKARARIRAREVGKVVVSVKFKPSGDKAEFCVTKEVEVRPVYDEVRVSAVTFTSDHGLLKDYDADWGDGGEVFAEPEWTKDRSNPISHTLGKKVRVRVTFTVEPSDAPLRTVNLRGSGPLTFKKRVLLRGGRNTFTVTSRNRLPREIGARQLKIHWWYFFSGDEKGTTAGTTRTQAFLTMGTPGANSRRPGITLKRMRQAVDAVGGANSLDPHAIAKHVIGKWSRFNLDQVYWNAWELADDKKDENGVLVGADCQTIVRYTENVIRMAGVPGKAEFIVVWAKVKSPAKGIANPVSKGHMGNPVQYHNDHFSKRDDRKHWGAFLIDGDNRPNNFEAALRFTYKRDKLYYPGGVRAVMHDADQVIRVFQSMSWVDLSDGLKVKDAIYEY